MVDNLRNSMICSEVRLQHYIPHVHYYYHVYNGETSQAYSGEEMTK